MHRIALLALLAACGSSAPASGSGSGSSPPPAPVSGSQSSECPDAEIAKRGDESIAGSVRYMTQLEDLATKAKGDCELARTGFIALEPEGTRFMTLMTETKAWGDTLTPACLARAKDRWEHSAPASKIEALGPKVQAAITELLDKCQDHPGFKDAVAKGLRVMRKKSP